MNGERTRYLARADGTGSSFGAYLAWDRDWARGKAAFSACWGEILEVSE